MSTMVSSNTRGENRLAQECHADLARRHFDRADRTDPLISTTGRLSSVTIGCSARSQARHAAQMNVREQAGGAERRGDREEVLGAGERLAAITGRAQLAGRCALRTEKSSSTMAMVLSVAVACAVFPDWRARYTVAVAARIAAICQLLVGGCHGRACALPQGNPQADSHARSPRNAVGRIPSAMGLAARLADARAPARTASPCGRCSGRRASRSQELADPRTRLPVSNQIAFPEPGRRRAARRHAGPAPRARSRAAARRPFLLRARFLRRHCWMCSNAARASPSIVNEGVMQELHRRPPHRTRDALLAASSGRMTGTRSNSGSRR